MKCISGHVSPVNVLQLLQLTLLRVWSGQRLRVERVVGALRLTQGKCGEDVSTTESVDGADLQIFVTMRPVRDLSTLAFASPCEMDQNYRCASSFGRTHTMKLHPEVLPFPVPSEIKNTMTHAGTMPIYRCFPSTSRI